MRSRSVSEADGITLGESVTVDPLSISTLQSEVLAVGDAPTLDPVAPTEISANVGVTIGDTPTVTVAVAGADLEIDISDAITIGEFSKRAVIGFGAGPPWKTKVVERGIPIPEKAVVRNIRSQRQMQQEEKEREAAEAEINSRRQIAEQRVKERQEKKEAARKRALVALEMAKDE
jgi:hypothetical protein